MYFDVNVGFATREQSIWATLLTSPRTVEGRTKKGELWSLHVWSSEVLCGHYGTLRLCLNFLAGYGKKCATNTSVCFDKHKRQILIEQFSVENREAIIQVSKSNWFCTYYSSRLAYKLAPIFHPIRSKKPKPIGQLHVILSSIDWFTVLSVSFTINQSDCFGLFWCCDTQLKTSLVTPKPSHDQS